jgi:hypothetical protein
MRRYFKDCRCLVTELDRRCRCCISGPFGERNRNLHGVQAPQTSLNAVASCPHIRPTVYTDLVLSALDEADAPGISEYRMQLDAILSGCTVDRLVHEQIISRLDQCAKMYGNAIHLDLS